MKSTAVCLRCGNPALAVLTVEATMGETRLAVSGEAGASPICAACVTELAEWFRGKPIGRRIDEAADQPSVGKPLQSL
jgi:hypothetical protein